MIGNFYATKCLSALGKTYKSIRPSHACKGMRLLHDNARPHKTLQVKAKIDSMQLIKLEHPPYIPDLSPCDFFLFDILKKSLVRRHFDEDFRVGTVIYKCLHDIHKYGTEKAFTVSLKYSVFSINNKVITSNN